MSYSETDSMDLAGKATVTAAFRVATLNDLEAIHDIRRDSILGIESEHFSPSELHAWAERRSPEFFAPRVEEGAIVLVVSDAGPIAWGSSAADKITGIYVRPSTWRAGVGCSLMARLEADIVGCGYRCVTLTASANAVGFYAKMGCVGGDPSAHGKTVLMTKIL